MCLSNLEEGALVRVSAPSLPDYAEGLAFVRVAFTCSTFARVNNERRLSLPTGERSFRKTNCRKLFCVMPSISAAVTLSTIPSVCEVICSLILCLSTPKGRQWGLQLVYRFAELQVQQDYAEQYRNGQR